MRLVAGDVTLRGVLMRVLCVTLRGVLMRVLMRGDA